MKVLMTGMSPPQCGRKTLTGYEHVSDLWAKGLRAGGAEVHHRLVVPDEDLTEYDLALIGLVPPNSIAARYQYTALDVMARAKASGCGLLFYVDDWRFYAITRGVKAMAKNPVRRYIENPLFDKFYERDWAVGPGWSRIVKMIEALRDREWPPTIMPAFTWGLKEKIPPMPSKRTIVIDPSSFVREYDIPRVDDNMRRCAWVLGTFSDQRHWQDSLNLTWETDYIGTRRSKAEKRMKEWDLVKLYGEAWGVLGAPYEHTGFGWWRNRFVYAAAGGAVMLNDPAETEGLVGYHKPAAEIEDMTTVELREFADFQATLMQGSYSSRDEVADQLMTAAREAHEYAQGSTSQENLGEVA